MPQFAFALLFDFLGTGCTTRNADTLAAAPETCFLATVIGQGFTSRSSATMPFLFRFL